MEFTARNKNEPGLLWVSSYQVEIFTEVHSGSSLCSLTRLQHTRNFYLIVNKGSESQETLWDAVAQRAIRTWEKLHIRYSLKDF